MPTHTGPQLPSRAASPAFVSAQAVVAEGARGLSNAGPRPEVFLAPELPHADGGAMITSYRPFIALALLAVGLAIFLVDNVSLGWTAIGVLGVLCLVLAIAAQLLAIRKHRAHN